MSSSLAGTPHYLWHPQSHLLPSQSSSFPRPPSPLLLPSAPLHPHRRHFPAHLCHHPLCPTYALFPRQPAPPPPSPVGTLPPSWDVVATRRCPPLSFLPALAPIRVHYYLPSPVASTRQHSLVVASTCHCPLSPIPNILPFSTHSLPAPPSLLSNFLAGPQTLCHQLPPTPSPLSPSPPSPFPDVAPSSPSSPAVSDATNFLPCCRFPTSPPLQPPIDASSVSPAAPCPVGVC